MWFVVVWIGNVMFICLFILELVMEGYLDKIVDVIFDVVFDVMLIEDFYFYVVVEIVVMIG